LRRRGNTSGHAVSLACAGRTHARRCRHGRNTGSAVVCVRVRARSSAAARRGRGSSRERASCECCATQQELRTQQVTIMMSTISHTDTWKCSARAS
jgi:hypothetical protein